MTKKKTGTKGRQTLSVAERRGFALRLYKAIRDRYKSFGQLTKALDAKGTRVREVTVRGWLPPLELLSADPERGSQVRARDWAALRTPDVPGLVEVASLLDVSLDYLLGFPVPERRSDREPPGELARALVEFVARDYAGRAPRPRRDGLVTVIGGELRQRPWTRDMQTVSRRKIGDRESEEGTVDVTGQHSHLPTLLLHVDQPQSFLKQVSDWVFMRAEQWEEENKESERQAVRDAIRSAIPVVNSVAEELNQTPEQMLDVMLNASLDPLNPKWQSWARMIGAEVINVHNREARDREFDADMARLIDEVVNEHPESPPSDTAPD